MAIDTVNDTKAVLAAGANASPAIMGTFLGLTPGEIVSIVGAIASAALPGVGVAGMTIAQLTGLSAGVANEVPEAIAAFEEITGLANSGTAPTAEQWASWNATADAAHLAAQAAADAVINGPGS